MKPLFPPSRDTRRSCGTSAAVILGLVAGVLAVPAAAQDNAFAPELRIDQDALLSGDYPLSKVLESGQQYFNVPFTPAGADASGDGLGEGHGGPRSFQRHAFWPYPWPAPMTDLAMTDAELNYLYEFPFVKLNGLGATSCFDCHSSIGTYTPPNQSGPGMVRKPGTPGGAGGFSTNAFVNSEYPARAVMLVRNPPHIFGTGYTNALGIEMTTDLRAQAEVARLVAQNTPGTAQSIALMSKGVDFGTFSTTYDASAQTFADDTSAVSGVSGDLVIRPFQWKGIASSVRHFVRDALDFHFSLQAVEKVDSVDCDLDGKSAEVSVGSVSALTAYVAMTRPPTQEIPTGQEMAVANGEAIFKGSAASVVALNPPAGAEAMCATCHVPKMPLDKATLTIFTPPDAGVTAESQCPDETASLINALPPDVPVESLVVFEALFPQVVSDARVQAALGAAGATPASVWQAMEPVLDMLEVGDLLAAGNYQIDLSVAEDPSLLPHLFPRLAANADGSVDVPLYSDLRQHNMGAALQDPASQGSDVAGIAIAPPIFVTRVLWGVGDSGPWMHDGRARTLTEAILLHRSEGSEASDVINVFSQLQAPDQADLIAFLESLRLPLPQTAQ
ncbi:di-heme oxidoredictase family protein [Thetidibacter halocola]|uniref:Cytochrome c domain-containing protein n=1 Tax=Thetidibacter halocola TaxID=2827239 RepID=A0A8J8BAG3_9RHOB|nr:di-heme oxidoredictase family protein [Thetidibacter halocola]MBS0126874.1 hypothetical protein [Thetidibacter halocola]